MSIELFKNLLASFKRSNKDRKLKLAQKAGYSTVEDYKKYLEEQSSLKVELETKKTVIPKSNDIKTIHIVDVIDCSGSMSGAKIRNAVKGINNGIDELKKDNIINYTYTLCDFSGCTDINFSNIVNKINNVNKVSFGPRGMTALYDAVGKTIKKVQKHIKDNEKVLVNIYTDGGENGSIDYNKTSLNELIKSVEGIFTVTFIGTNYDVELVSKNLGIDKSNTLSYDGSAKGLGETMLLTKSARNVYADSVVAGKDVSLGFYKNIKK